MELAFAAGEWAAVGVFCGIVAAILATALTFWKLIDRVAGAVRGVVREEQAPTNQRLDHLQAEVTEIRDEQRTHIDYALRRDEKIDDHAQKIGGLDARVTRVEHHLWPEEVN